MNLPETLTRITFSPETTARFLGLMLIAWQPFSGGARLPTLLLTLLGIWMLFKGRIDLSSHVTKRIGTIFLLLLVPVLTSIPGSFDPSGSAAVGAVLVLFYVVGLTVMQGLKTEADHIWLQRWLTVTLIAWLADGFIQYFFGRDILGIPLSSDGRIMGPFSDNLHFGLFITVLTPIMLWRMAKEQPLWAIGIMLLIGFVSGMSGARSNMLFFVLSCATLILRFDWRLRLLIAPSLAAALFASTILSPNTLERFNRFSTIDGQASFSQFQKMDHILSGRMTIWETGLAMVKDHPLTGVGTSAFAEAYDQYSTRPDDAFRSDGDYKGGVYHAHQMYVSIAAESGLIGLLGLSIAISMCIYWYKQSNPTQKSKAAPYIASLTVIFFPLQSQPVLYTIWWFPLILLLTAGMLSSLSTHSADQANTSR